MSFADSIKTLRKKSFLTQEEFAKEIGVVSATVNRWETGKAKPNMTAMKAIKSYCKSNDLPYDEIEKGWLSYQTEDNNE